RFLPAHPFRLAFEHPAFLFGREIAPRHVERNAAQTGVFDDIVLTFGEARRLPGSHGTAAQSFGFVGHYQPEIDTDDAAEPAAGFACAERRIERKKTRRRFRVVNIAVRAVQIRRKTPYGRKIDGCIGFSVANRVHIDAALTDAQRTFERLYHSRTF